MARDGQGEVWCRSPSRHRCDVLAGLSCPARIDPGRGRFGLAITAAGVISKVALVLAVYIAVRPVGLGYAAAAAVMVGMSGAYGEMYAWGGFPQQLGTALGVVATFYLIRYVQSRNVRHLAVSAVAVALTLFTHNLVGGLLVGALLLAVVHWLYLTRADRKAWTSGLLDAATLVLPAGAFVGVALVLGRGAGVQPSLNPNELTWGQSIEHMIGEAPIPWLVVTVIALALGMSRKWSGPNALTVAVGGSWLVASLAFFLVVGEPRALLFDPNGSRDDCDLGVRGTATDGERPEHLCARFSCSPGNCSVLRGRCEWLHRL